MTVFVVLCSETFFIDLFHSENWMSATPNLVFTHREYWRLWTAFLIHADAGHLLGNLFLFLPMTYVLVGYFGLWLIPSLSFLSGGLINFIVLKTMPSEMNLLGISGVVYWMGGLWMTLYLLIDRRFPWRRRIANVLFIGLFLLVPEKYNPQVSYRSHVVGLFVGILCGFFIYQWRKKEFIASEKYVIEEEEEIKREQSF